MELRDYIIDWSNEKNLWLEENRGVTFEIVEIKLMEKDIIDVVHNPNSRYPHQYMIVVNIEDYIYIVPFVIDEENKLIFLKTIIPSRKYTKKYLK